MEVFSFIEGFYNPLRRHSRLGATSASPPRHTSSCRRPRCPADGCHFTIVNAKDYNTRLLAAHRSYETHPSDYRYARRYR